ncbi:Uncharacterised protein [uncultured archaeon]|nr:Uncharacterised protein [uncultured archaeon]
MESRELLYACFGFLALTLVTLALFYWFFSPHGLSGNREIENFTGCAEAGNTVIQTYPRTCILADGTQFLEDPDVPGCAGDYECDLGYYCNLGDCGIFSPEKGCASDGDCALADSTLRLSCCYAGACNEIDYSQPKWVAVNSGWLLAQRAINCPPASDCGPAPLCAVWTTNSSFRAACLNSTCEKIPA